MPISNKTEWYGVNAAVVRKTDNITEYSITCDTPNGKMKVFHLFPGIDYAETSLMYCAAYLRIYMRFPAIPIIPRIKHSAIYG